MIFLFIQIIYGGFVAGLNAGLIHNHWPLMSDGQLIHDSVFLEYNSIFLNLVEGKSGVQLVHRTFAYVVFGLVLALFIRNRKLALNTQQLSAGNWLMGIVLMQFVLGVLTLLYAVPLWLGLAHQLGAFILLSVMTFYLHRVSK